MRILAGRSVGAALLAVAGCLLLAGCAEGVGTVPGRLPSPTVAAPAVPTPTATVTHGEWGTEPTTQPPPFLVRYGGTQLELFAFTFCSVRATNGVSADGFDDNPPSIGSPAEIFVFVPVGGVNQLTVTQATPGRDCDTIEAEVDSLGGGWWVVRPVGPGGDYRVSLFASGEGAGDMVADVLWQTPDDQPAADPTAGYREK